MNTSPTPPRFDWTAVLALVCLALSWFWMSSLVTDLIAVRLHFHFYNMLTLMRSPESIVMGAGSADGTRDAWLFGTVCMAALFAPIAPLISSRKVAWLGCVVPLALMVLCGAILYHEYGGGGDAFADTGKFGTTGSQLVHLANELTDKIGSRMARRVTVGLGGPLALAASAFLAVKGLLGYRGTP